MRWRWDARQTVSQERTKRTHDVQSEDCEWSEGRQNVWLWTNQPTCVCPCRKNRRACRNNRHVRVKPLTSVTRDHPRPTTRRQQNTAKLAQVEVYDATEADQRCPKRGGRAAAACSGRLAADSREAAWWSGSKVGEFFLKRWGSRRGRPGRY